MILGHLGKMQHPLLMLAGRQRPHFRCGIERVAQPDRPGKLGETVQEFLGNRAMQDEP
ncbi:hypothetical protein D3C87_1922830 [compost metagenome]